MSGSVSQHRLSEGRKPVSSVSDFILYNVASSLFHQALILKRGQHTCSQTTADLSDIPSFKYWNMWDRRQRIGNKFCFFLYVVACFFCALSPVKAVSVLIEVNLRVISCLCLWMIRCSSNWKRCSTPTEWERNEYRQLYWHHMMMRRSADAL